MQLLLSKMQYIQGTNCSINKLWEVLETKESLKNIEGFLKIRFVGSFHT